MIALGCNSFMSCEKRLQKNASVRTGIVACKPLFMKSNSSGVEQLWLCWELLTERPNAYKRPLRPNLQFDQHHASIQRLNLSSVILGTTVQQFDESACRGTVKCWNSLFSWRTGSERWNDSFKSVQSWMSLCMPNQLNLPRMVRCFAWLLGCDTL